MSVSEHGIKFVSYTFSTALAALGDTIRISVKVKNTSGSALNSVNSYLSYNPAVVPSNYHPNVLIYPEQGRVTSIASGATKTYDFDVTLTKDWNSYSVLQDGRLPGEDSTHTAFRFAFGSGSYSLSVQDKFSDMRSKGLTIFYERVKPTITAGCVRSVATGAVNDEGEYLLTSISATCPKTAAELAAGGYPTVPTVKYSTSEETIRAGGGDAMTVGDNMNIGAMLTGIAEYTMVGGVPTPSASITGVSDRVIRNQLSNGNNYYISITFDDPYEPVVLYLSAPRAFANVHLSGASTGGVAFGKFSAATEDNPLFECMYPAKFYNGYKEYATEETPVGKWIDGKTIYRKVVADSTTYSWSAASSSAQAKTIPAGVSNVETLVQFTAWRVTSTGSMLPLPMPNCSNTYAGWAISTAGLWDGTDTVSITYGRYSAQSNVKFMFIYEYTKTTD